MKILFVCVDRYPDDGACTSLLKKLFFDGGLAEAENEIHIATYQYHFSDKSTETVDTIKIHRFFSPRYLSVSELLKKKHRLDLLFRGGMIKLQKKISLKLHGGIILDKGQIKEFEKHLLRLCREEGYDVIVGVAGSYEMTIAAQNVSTSLQVPFVLYQVDPFTDNVIFSSKDVPQRLKIEKNLYKRSAQVFTTEIILTKMKERMSDAELANVEIMEFPGVSVDTSLKKKPATCPKDDIIECVFAGRVYMGVRNPTFTIELFRKLPESIRLKLYGVTEKELKNFFSVSSLPDNVECCGLVRVEEAENAIQNADVLVNIGNIMVNQVPSKLFSYIATGKPILNVCVNHDCPSKKYLEAYPYALSIDEGSSCGDSVIQGVSAFLTRNAGKVCDLDEIKNLYEKCTPTYAANQMRAAFERITEMTDSSI